MNSNSTEKILDHFEEEHLPKGEGNWKRIVIIGGVIYLSLRSVLLWLQGTWINSVVHVGDYYFNAHDVLLLLAVAYIANALCMELNLAWPHRPKAYMALPPAVVILIVELLLLFFSIFVMKSRSMEWMLDKQQLLFVVLLSWLGSLISYFKVHRLRGESIAVPALLLFIFIAVFGWVF